MSIINIDILSKKDIIKDNQDTKIWYLCKGNLLDYLDNLKKDFYDFAIQRRIVKNQYLDHLYQTVKDGDPIPMITLTCNKPYLIPKDANTATLDLSKIEILDGLQRTFRLWTYKKLCEEYENHVSSDASNIAKAIKSENPLFFDSGVLSTSKIRLLIENGEISEIKKVFTNFDIYFVIWAGLNEKEIVQKMLQLNAGQKSVSKTHQFELLFLHFYDDLIEDKEIKLVREKSTRATLVKKGEGELGEFMFSSVIVALQSFVEGKPLRITTENLIGEDSDDDTSDTIFKAVFTLHFMKKFLMQLKEIEEIIYIKESVAGKEWFVKDTTLSGLFAAIGNNINIKEIASNEIESQTELVVKKLKNLIKDNGINLSDFKAEYNILSSRAGNIGVFIRSVINNYFTDLLNDGKPSWNTAFLNISERNKK